MGIQTMATQSGGGGGQQPQIHNLARQGSLYSLTLDEVQNHLGEPLSSMNLDELLKSVFPPDGNQFSGIDVEGAASQLPSGSGLQRQGSITVPRGLSKKTVDEVWRDIEQGEKNNSEERSAGHERQTTLGEMTLEDFLLRAGIVSEGSVKKGNDLVGNLASVGAADPMAAVHDYNQRAHWLQQYQQQQQAQQSMISAYVPGRPVPQPLGTGTAPILDAVYTDGQMSMSSPTVGGLSDSHTPGRKRGASGGGADKLVERRQKRMIKNRESAARSRARKQAYTNELENKVSRLEEENERLKKLRELDKLLSVPPPEPKYQLRRTSSAPCL